MEYQIIQLEKQAEDMKQAIVLAEMVTKLEANYEFRKLILEHLCVDQAARYVQASVDSAIQDPVQRADALAIAQSTGYLLKFLDVTKAMGAAAHSKLVEIQDAIIQIRAEGEE